MFSEIHVTTGCCARAFTNNAHYSGTAPRRSSRHGEAIHYTGEALARQDVKKGKMAKHYSRVCSSASITSFLMANMKIL